MQSKYFFTFILFLLLSLSVISALDVGYVVRTPSNLDVDETALKVFLDGEGYNTVILDDVSFDETAYDLIIVSESVSDIGNIFDHKNTRTIFLSNNAAEDKGLSGNFGVSSGRFATIERSEGVTDGYSLGDIQVYDNQDSLEYLSGCYAQNSRLLVSKSDNTKAMIITYDTNALLIDSSCTDRDIQIFQKNLYFGLVSVNEWNNNAEALFRNSISWLIESQDLDGDGYDGVLDCNDDDANVHPGATEIAYNGVDDDCSDGDLADVDLDGYDSSAVGGDDCNDNDATINPGSSDPDKDCVNDGPTIESFSPTTPIDLLENSDNTFSVTYSDVDNVDDVSVTWKVNGLTDGFGNSYVFNEAEGDYTVIATVSDGSFDTLQTWIVGVKDSSFFTCSEVSGDICSSDEQCTGDTLGVSDSNSCCSTTCELKDPTFDKANVCTTTENDIEIDLINIDNGENYDVDEDIDISVRVRNRLDDDKDFKVTAYLYDLTDDKVLEKESENLDVNEDKSQIVAFSFPADLDIDEDHNYALLVVAKDGECNQAYERIDIERTDHEVIVERIDISPNELACGYPLDMDVKLKNIGGNDEDAYIKVKSSKLKIDEKSESFDIDSFGGDDDTHKEEFNFILPDNVKSGDYTIRTEVYYNNKIERFDKSITLGACGNEVVAENNEAISLGGAGEENEGSISLGGITGDAVNIEGQEGDLETEGGSSVLRSIFLVCLIVFLGVAGFVVYQFTHN